MSARRRSGDAVLWAVFGASVAVTVLTLVVLQLIPPPALPPGSGPVYPRMPAPPAWNAGELLRVMGIGSLTWYACVLSAPLFIVIARRLPLDRRSWTTGVLTYALVIGVLITLTALLRYRLSYAGAPIAPPIGMYVRAAWLTDFLPFLAVAAATQAVVARSRARERELEAARLHGQLAEARLEALTAQLQPHFLFNTLQSISTLIAHDPVGADRMLTSLSDLLREVLRRGERELPLEEELRVLESYLDISRVRFGARLHIGVAVDDAAGRALVPFFVLQPLVENALHHGVGSRAGPCTVTIAARRQDGRLKLVVTDDGPGQQREAERQGIGLANTRERLIGLYGPNCMLAAGPRAEGGFEVVIVIPFRRAADA